MPRLLLPALLGVCAACAHAQPRPTSGSGEPQYERDLRRAELRTVLQANRSSEQRLGAEAGPVQRHLSARELAEMREQLRQQQLESGKSRQ